MASLHKVKVAKEALRKQLGAPPWLRGVGVIAGDDGLCLQVGVAEVSDDVRRQIPATVEGVAVQVAAVGDIQAPPPREQHAKRASKPSAKATTTGKRGGKPAKKPVKRRAVA
ncbi:MAG: hypothetical protein HYS27_02995 [Deltaproteobacteria bacterium]|nr:hypothetical protein [Deltaproteobacteria bacterium]